MRFFWHIFRWLAHAPAQAVLCLIRLYQRTLSPDHGLFKRYFSYGYCRFTPTCSVYGYEAIKKYGLFRGGCKTLWRILRCNPWSRGGVNPP